MLEVSATGPLTTVQDLGRTGWSSLGVGTSGAADRRSHDAANRLVGNTIDAATLEVTLGGLVLRARTAVVLAVTGAPTPFTVDGVPQGHGAVVVVGSGAEIRLDWAPVGLRTYVAVRGGIDVPGFSGADRPTPCPVSGPSEWRPAPCCRSVTTPRTGPGST